jgi:hypothetical protein
MDDAPCSVFSNDERLDEIERLMWAIGVYAAIGQDYARLSDVAGLEYNLKCLRGYLLGAIHQFKQLSRSEMVNVDNVHVDQASEAV